MSIAGDFISLNSSRVIISIKASIPKLEYTVKYVILLFEVWPFTAIRVFCRVRTETKASIKFIPQGLYHNVI